jgi:hypothetical protein
LSLIIWRTCLGVIERVSLLAAKMGRQSHD